MSNRKRKLISIMLSCAILASMTTALAAPMDTGVLPAYSQEAELEQPIPDYEFVELMSVNP